MGAPSAPDSMRLVPTVLEHVCVDAGQDHREGRRREVVADIRRSVACRRDGIVIPWAFLVAV
jgi:hypothetical protein